jgi:hypothetical protein
MPVLPPITLPEADDHYAGSDHGLPAPRHGVTGFVLIRAVRLRRSYSGEFESRRQSEASQIASLPVLGHKLRLPAVFQNSCIPAGDPLGI